MCIAGTDVLFDNLETEIRADGWRVSKLDFEGWKAMQGGRVAVPSDYGIRHRLGSRRGAGSYNGGTEN